FARRRFPVVTAKITRASVNAYFERERTIPHPTISPCSIDLKIDPRKAWLEQHPCDYTLIGFVRTERRRIARQEKYREPGILYPIQHMTDEDCFDLVKQCIGWYPA